MNDKYPQSLRIDIPESLVVEGSDSRGHQIDAPVVVASLPVDGADNLLSTISLQASIDALSKHQADTTNTNADIPSLADNNLDFAEELKAAGDYLADKPVSVGDLTYDLNKHRNELASLVASRRTQLGRVTSKEYDARYKKVYERYSAARDARNEAIKTILADKGVNEHHIQASIDKKEKNEATRFQIAESAFRSGDQKLIQGLYEEDMREYRGVDITIDLPDKPDDVDHGLIGNLRARFDNSNATNYLRDKSDTLTEYWAEKDRKSKLAITVGVAAVGMVALGTAGAVGAGGLLARRTWLATKKGFMFNLNKQSRDQKRLGLGEHAKLSDQTTDSKNISMDKMLETADVVIEQDRKDNRIALGKIAISSAVGMVFGKYLGKAIDEVGDHVKPAIDWAKDAFDWTGDKIEDAYQWSADGAQDIFSNIPVVGDGVEWLDDKLYDVLGIGDDLDVETPDTPDEDTPPVEDKPDTESTPDADTDAKINDLEQQIDASEKELDELEERTEKLEADLDEAEQEIDELEAENAELEAELDELQAEVDGDVELGIDDGPEVDGDNDTETDVADGEVDPEIPEADAEEQTPAPIEVDSGTQEVSLLVEDGEGFQKALKDQYGLNDDQSWRAYLAIKPHLAEQGGVYEYNGDFRISSAGAMNLNPQASAALQGFLDTLSEDEEILAVTG